LLQAAAAEKKSPWKPAITVMEVLPQRTARASNPHIMFQRLTVSLKPSAKENEMLQETLKTGVLSHCYRCSCHTHRVLRGKLLPIADTQNLKIFIHQIKYTIRKKLTN